MDLETVNRRRRYLGMGLIGGAALLLLLNAGLIRTGVLGARSLTGEELERAAGTGTTYVSFTTSEVVDTGVLYGKRGNEGTKYLLVRAADDYLLTSARVSFEGRTFTGSLEAMGYKEKQALRMVLEEMPEYEGRILPAVLHTAGTTGKAVLLLLGALFMLVLGGAAILRPLERLPDHLS